MTATRITRRRAVSALLAVGAGSAIMSACGATPTPQVVEKEVTKLVEGTPVVVKETVEVEKVVKETVVVESTVAAQGPASIRFSVWYGQGDIEVWDQVIDAFEKADGQTRVDFEPLAWSQYWQKLQVGLAAGDPPDAIGMGVGVVYDYGARKQIRPLDPFLERDQVSKEQWFVTLLEEAVWPKPGGELFALPYRFTGSAFFINKTLFDKFGVAYPEKGWTWPDDYLTMARALTDPAQEVWGSSVPGDQLVEPFLATADTSALTPDLRHSNFNDPKVADAYGFLTDLICKEQVAPRPQDVQGMGDVFLSGKVAMHPDAQWNITAYRGITDFEWDIAYNPLRSGVNKPGTYGGPDMLSIPDASKDPEAAWRMTLFVTGSPEAQKLMSATGVPTLVEQAAAPSFVEEQAKLGPANYGIIIEQAQNAYGFSFSPAWNEWMAAYGQVLRELYNCNLDLAEAMAQIHTQVEDIVTQAYEKLGV